MSDNFATNFLKSDTHGIPNWVWLLIIAGGVGVGIYFKNKASNQPTGSNQTATGTGPVDTSNNPPDNTPPPATNPPPPPGPKNTIVVGVDVPNGTTVQQVADKYSLGYSQICSLNSWLKCGQPVVAGGAYDFNLPGNVDGKTFRIGP